MIKIQQINKSFKQTKVLENISFDIFKGDYLAVMGPSGSGKSTLLYSVSGMDHIDSGHIVYEDKDIAMFKEKELSAFRLHEMGFVFQHSEMLKNLSIFDNIMLPGLISNKKTYDDLFTHAKALMDKTKISELEKRDIKEVSGGQIQRATICRAMINEPKVLFLDEPTGALNSEATNQVLDILGQLNDEGTTIMMVTHDPYVASKAKKVLYLIDGKVAGTLDLNESKDRFKSLSLWLGQFKA